MTCAVAMSCASLYLPCHTSSLTFGRYSLASGFALLLGRPAQIVSSLSCRRSAAGVPYTIAPSRLLPIGRASVHIVAGLSYHRMWLLPFLPGAAAAGIAAVASVSAAADKSIILFIYIMFVLPYRRRKCVVVPNGRSRPCFRLLFRKRLFRK